MLRRGRLSIARYLSMGKPHEVQWRMKRFWTLPSPSSPTIIPTIETTCFSDDQHYDTFGSNEHFQQQQQRFYHSDSTTTTTTAPLSQETTTHHLLKVFEFGLGKENVQSLPEYFMKFHTGQRVDSTPLIARGHLIVTRGSNWFTRILATIGGLPKENLKGALVMVTVDDEEHGGMWKRTFDGQEMNSKWDIQRGCDDDGTSKKDHSYVVESFVPFSFGFELIPIYGRLEEEHHDTSSEQVIGFEHAFRKMWMFNIPVPKMFALDPSGKSVCVNSRSWHVEVNISNPLLGRICSYRGIMTAEKKS
ncbi:hypothetical protein FDP41_005413 [Naegleria fowleri]|uniref:DUF4166 domain-containing protein n=1 Tax=Naegleria fowleri TaxID=5763 RepID=A0A6A5BR51_NAEFO|nr:uncharacterized protein FDP41_005413 [Naegleria fowleri]KAF0975419.1 hypothetical protein FDP41_005413 [Naegleria fowleri]